MNILVKKTSPLKTKTPCLVLFAFDGRLRQELFDQLDQLFNGHLTAVLTAKEFQGRSDETLMLHNPTKQGPERILLVGLGKPARLTVNGLRQATCAAATELKKKRLLRFALDVRCAPSTKIPAATYIQTVAEGLLLANYQYERYLSAKRPDRLQSLEQATLLTTDSATTKVWTAAIATAQAICAGVTFARDLVNAPGNEKSPEFLAFKAVAMAEQHGLKANLLDVHKLRTLGFGALLGVAQGSERPPYLIVLQYQGTDKEKPPVALVGKGVTFDTGGISLKPAEKMDEMKMDMGGAAAVLGTLLSAAQLQLPINLVAVIPAVENMPSGKAIRPGDILTSLSGKTIEVMNTDAEGRLILADALTYVQRFKPRAVIDVATLTGACIIALGHHAAAVLGNDDKLMAGLCKAGERSGERLWQLPLWEEYATQIKSDFADLKNTGGRPAGTITAAAFLQAFAESCRWAHLDIAGMAWEDRGVAGRPRGGTGFGVRILIEYLRAVADR